MTISRARIALLGVALAGIVAGTRAGLAQSPADDPGNFISIDAPVVALTNVRVIDGTGAPARNRQTIVIRDGTIAALGDAATVRAPDNARIIDLSGKSVMPGLVMLHEHLFYPTSPSFYAETGESFVRLYLAGGVTTIRTGGTFNAASDLRIAQAISAGSVAGPTIDVTGPYLDGPVDSLQMMALKDADDARRQVAYWSDMGATSFKAYMNITRAELGAVIAEAHRRGHKVTGHLCSVTYGEAAALGIDNLEHGLAAATDFVPGKQRDLCPGQDIGHQTLLAQQVDGPALRDLLKTLVDRHVTLTSTLPVFDTIAPGRPMPRGLDVLVPTLRTQVETTYAQIADERNSLYGPLLRREMALERAFVAAGGALVAGSDPTAYGGVIPGFGNTRALELLVEAGFSPLEAIQIGTLNGARYLGRDNRVGSIAVGKQADLIVVNGNPSQTIGDVRQIETVFKQGVGYDPVRLIESVKGRVGLW